MIISKEYKELMFLSTLVERFRAGDFYLDEDEVAIIEDFINSFYKSARQNGCITYDDFIELMDLLDLLRDGDTDEVQNLLTLIFLECCKLRNEVEKQKQSDK